MLCMTDTIYSHLVNIHIYSGTKKTRNICSSRWLQKKHKLRIDFMEDSSKCQHQYKNCSSDNPGSASVWLLCTTVQSVRAYGLAYDSRDVLEEGSCRWDVMCMRELLLYTVVTAVICPCLCLCQWRQLEYKWLPCSFCSFCFYFAQVGLSFLP